MVDPTPGIATDVATIRAAALRLLDRNRWRLLDPDELAGRALRILAEAPAAAGQGAEAAPPLPQPGRHLARRPHGVEPVDAALLRAYSEALYAAFLGRRGEGAQERAYQELRRYAGHVAARFGADLSRDEREEIAAHALTELFCRYAAPAPQPGLPPDGTAGCFIAVTLQQVRNTLRAWRSQVGPWVPLERPDRDQAGGPATPEPPDQAGDHNPEDQAERREQREQVARAFATACERYPQARVQLYAVWLYIVEDLSYGTIAERLATTVGHARVLTWRGLRRLHGDPDFRTVAQQAQLLHVADTHAGQPPAEYQREHGNG